MGDRRCACAREAAKVEVIRIGSVALRSAPLRAGLRRKEGSFFFAYPALIPQRAMRASETYRATIIRPWRDWSIADESLLYFSSEWEEQNRHPALRRVSPFLCRGGAKRKPARAFARRDCTVRRENSLMLHGDAIILGILPLPLASPSASSGSFVVGQDDRGKKARRGPNSLRSPVLKSMGWARTLIRT